MRYVQCTNVPKGNPSEPGPLLDEMRDALVYCGYNLFVLLFYILLLLSVVS